MTLSDLLDSLYQDLGYEAIPSAPVTRRLTKYLNDGYRSLLSMPELAPLRIGTVKFTSNPGQTVYGVPQVLVQIEQLVNATSATRLRLMTADEFRAIDPQEVSSGTPTHYVPYGVGPALRLPDRTGLWASDRLPLLATPVTITVRGVGGDDYFPFPPASALVTGDTRVKVGNHNDYSLIQDVQLDHAVADEGSAIMLFDAALGGHLLASIVQGQTTVSYTLIRLWPTPSATDQYVADGPIVLADLSASVPVPVIPPDFQDILADFARMREYEYRDDSRYAMAQNGYREKLKYLRERICNPPDYRPRVGRLRDRSNNLDHDGVNFPVGRW